MLAMRIRPAKGVLIAIDTDALHDRHRPARVRRWIEDKNCHVIEVDGEVAAYGVLHYKFFESGFIEMLVVGERFRRRGWPQETECFFSLRMVDISCTRFRSR